MEMEFPDREVLTMLKGKKLLIVTAGQRRAEEILSEVARLGGDAVQVDYSSNRAVAIEGRGSLHLAVMAENEGDAGVQFSWWLTDSTVRFEGDDEPERPFVEEISWLPRDEWMICIQGRKLIVGAWARGSLRHHVAFDLSDPGDQHISLEDLEKVFPKLDYF